MNRWTANHTAILLGLLLLAPTLRAQEMNDLQDTLGDLPRKKMPSILHRPKEDSAVDQLAWAQDLLKRGKKRDARKQFLALVHQWHTSPEAPTAQMAYAELLQKGRKYSKAFEEFQYLIDNFAGDFSYEKVLDQQLRIANYVMTDRHFTLGFLPGFQAPEQALPLFKKIVANAPNWKMSPRAQFSVGLINEQLGKYDDAIKAYEVVQLTYKKSSFATEASFRRASCLYSTALSCERDEKVSRAALSALAAFLRDSPDNANAETAARNRDELTGRLATMYFDRAVFYDKKARKPQAAIIAYSDFIKKFPSSEKVDQAQDRVKILKDQLEDTGE